MKNDPFSELHLIEHSHITIFSQAEGGDISDEIRGIIDNKDIKILLPKDPDTLVQASQNSGLILIDMDSLNPEQSNVVYKLRENRLIVCDIGGISRSKDSGNISPSLYLQGFDFFFALDDFSTSDCKKFILKRLELGSQRLVRLIQEEEYRRFRDALSSAPASVMVFDDEKRIVFVSEHYFRAYPKSAARLIRGLSVYDAFEMMSKEEELDQESELFQSVRTFWYNLNGNIEFTLDSGVSYRLSAVPLSNNRGTIVTAVNITEYMNQKSELLKLQQELSSLKS